jgi:hypothetical protein
MKITRYDAIKIIGKITHQDDPYWDYITEDWYDKENDDWPTIYDVYEALGITKEEYDNVILNLKKKVLGEPEAIPDTANLP